MLPCARMRHPYHVAMTRRNCSICMLPIAGGALCYAGTIDEAAARLLDTDQSELVPSWEMPDGTLRLAFCQACARDLASPDLLTGVIPPS